VESCSLLTATALLDVLLCCCRVHVPVITMPGRVHFQVGANPAAMREVLFAAGNVLELNNQAKVSTLAAYTRHTFTD
jgi:hypothetical protein